MFFKLTTHHEPWGSVDQSKWVWPTHPRSQVPSHRSYHQWLSMGATFVDDPELVPVLSGIHLLTLEGWKTGLVLQPKDIERSVGVTSTENRTWVTRMVAQWFTHYAAAVFKIGSLKNFSIFTGKHLCWSSFLINLLAMHTSLQMTQLAGKETIFNNSTLKLIEPKFIPTTLPR